MNDDDYEDRPRKRRRRNDDDEDDYDDRPLRKSQAVGGYKTSPVRFVVLGILVVVMLVLAYMLYQKRERERADAPPNNAGFLRDEDVPIEERTAPPGTPQLKPLPPPGNPGGGPNR